MKSTLFFTILLVAALSGYSQEYGHRLYDRVQKAHNSGVDFKPLHLFTVVQAEPNNYVQKYVALTPHKSQISALYNNRPSAVSLTVRAANGNNYSLEMLESHPLADIPHIGYIDETGRHETAFDKGVHYQGALKGFEKSVATMSVFANGDVMILFSNDDGNFNLGKLEDNSGLYALYNTGDRFEEIPFSCKATEGSSEVREQSRAESKGTGVVECRKIRLYWECDYQYYVQKNSSLANSQSYALGLFNIVQGLYYNDGMVIEMSGLFVWTAPDPYKSTGSYDALSKFASYWSAFDNTIYGDLGHLIVDGQGWSGYAYIGTVCISPKYAASDLLGSQSGTFPAYDVDVYVIAHETGHNIGAQHSHSCSWNTGPGGTCGAVDNCSGPERWGNCNTCSSLYDINTPGWQATIMSYCGGFINFSAGFGSVISKYLRNQINKYYTCLKPVIAHDLTSKDICSNDGAVTVNFKANNFGVAPYTYTWSNGQVTQNITSLSVPGTYNVTITDSNSCAVSDSVVVRKMPIPRNGQALTVSLPLCCRDTSYKVVLKASLPIALTDCQTVMWLRTSSPVISYSDLRQAYLLAGKEDILASDNNTLIDNATSAVLSVQSPDTCVYTGYYYTPFVARASIPDSVYTIVSGSQFLLYHPLTATTVGSGARVWDNSSMLSPCHANDTAFTDTITVTVNNYTGTPNMLGIKILREDNSLLYSVDGLAGNGVYEIPMVYTGSHFKVMKVLAYDNTCPSGGGACVSSILTMQIVSKITYPAIPALTMDTSCVVGTSVFLSFGPDSCKVLGINDLTHEVHNVRLFPNPAKSAITIEFGAVANGNGDILLTDISGQVLEHIAISYSRGINKQKVNISNLPKGMYFVALECNGASSSMLKLTIL